MSVRTRSDRNFDTPRSELRSCSSSASYSILDVVLARITDAFVIPAPTNLSILFLDGTFS